MPPLKRFWPILLAAALLALAFATGLHQEISWAWFVAHREQVEDAVAMSPIRSAFAYAAAYVLLAAACVPGAVWLTIVGGFLFGTKLGSALAVVGASSGATLLFLAARTSFAAGSRTRHGAMVDRMRPSLERDGFGFLLFLRLLPIVPFWLANLAPAFVGMRLRPFVVATALGIIPGTVVFASVGAGLDNVLSQSAAPDLSVVFTRPVLLPLAGVALLALLPIAWRLQSASEAGPSGGEEDG